MTHTVPCEWITETTRAKREFKWAAESVKISTVHSGKGMDAPIVIVLTAEEFNAQAAQTDGEKLMYVALTRAREYIMVLYTGENAVVKRLKEAYALYQAKLSIFLEWEKKTLSEQVSDC